MAVMTTEQLKEELERLYDLQESDEHLPAKAKAIRETIDRVEKELRFRRSR